MWAADLILAVVFAGLLTVLMVLAFGRDGPGLAGGLVLLGALVAMGLWALTGLVDPQGRWGWSEYWLGWGSKWGLFLFSALALVIILSAVLPAAVGSDLPARRDTPHDIHAQAAIHQRRATILLACLALLAVLLIAAAAVIAF